jgi:hypothetical protein
MRLSVRAGTEFFLVNALQFSCINSTCPDTPQRRGVLLASLTLISSQANTHFLIHSFSRKRIFLKKNEQTSFREAKGKIRAQKNWKFSSARKRIPFYRKDNKLFLKGLLIFSKLVKKSPNVDVFFFLFLVRRTSIPCATDNGYLLLPGSGMLA